MPECTVSRAFGSSEAPTITLGVRDKAEQERGATTDGRIVNNDVRVISTVTGAVVRDGEEGEIIARGPELMLGYTDPLLTAEAFDEEGFFHTGDLGCSDGEFLTVTGRKKDLIVRGGENISPQEIEDALGVHPAICEVAVVAMPHERMGEGVCAYIVARQPVSVAQLGEFLGQRGLARQKWPERVELVDALPRTASGKIQKNILRDRARLALKSGPPPL
jgi:non-ribosomal peptide synthetase component E (peptide arylation enzyme)